MAFKVRHHNRAYFPDKHIVVCEDAIHNQKRFANKLSGMFHSEGTVRISYVPDAISAAMMIEKLGVNLIILDYDMPFGNGHDLIIWLKSVGLAIPILTATGWEPNNESFKEVLSDYKGPYKISLKEDVINGINDTFILEHIQ